MLYQILWQLVTWIWSEDLKTLPNVYRKKPSHSKTVQVAYGKKYFTWLYVLRYPFIPTNPLLARLRLFCFFLSFFLNLVHSSPEPE